MKPAPEVSFNKKDGLIQLLFQKMAKEGFIKGTYYDGFAYYLGVSSHQ